MPPSPGGRGRPVGVQFRRSLFGVAAAILLVVGAGGAQAAGGQLDLTFGAGGMVLTDLGTDSADWANAVALQKDGKIVAAGFSDAAKGSGGDFALVRYTTSGKLDESFGSGGTVLTDLSHESEATAVAVQKDGKIVDAGTSDANAGLSFALVRYTTGGKLDKSFGSGGTVLTTFGGGDSGNEASAVAIQADGKIVVAGSSDVRGGWDFALVRYTAGGRLDGSFGSRGKVLTDLGTNHDVPSAVALQADGKIVVAGSSRLVRYTSGGKLDASFGRGGKVLTDLGGGASAIAIQKDGRIVAAGSGDAAKSTDVLASDFMLVRYTTGGKLDVSFGTAGKVRSDLGESEGATAVAIQAGGKIVAAVNDPLNEERRDFELVRYTAGGKLDKSFGRGGKVLTDLGGSAAALAIALQRDGKIVAAGVAGGDFALARYVP